MTCNILFSDPLQSCIVWLLLVCGRVCLNIVSSSVRIYVIHSRFTIHNFGTQHIIFRPTAKLYRPTVAALWRVCLNVISSSAKIHIILYWRLARNIWFFRSTAKLYHFTRLLLVCGVSASTLYRRQPRFILYTAGLHTIPGSVSMEMRSGCVLCRVWFPCETRFTNAFLWNIWAFTISLACLMLIQWFWLSTFSWM